MKLSFAGVEGARRVGRLSAKVDREFSRAHQDDQEAVREIAEASAVGLAEALKGALTDLWDLRRNRLEPGEELTASSSSGSSL